MPLKSLELGLNSQSSIQCKFFDISNRKFKKRNQLQNFPLRSLFCLNSFVSNLFSRTVAERPHIMFTVEFLLDIKNLD